MRTSILFAFEEMEADNIAPVNHYGTDNSTREFPPLLYEEVPLFDNNTTSQEKETIENVADVYSIIIALDHIEKAYLRDSISSNHYTQSVNKLLAQYRTYMNMEDVANHVGDLHQFKEKYNIIASNAITRLERGIPVTVEHAIDDDQGTSNGDKSAGSESGNNKNSGKYNAKNVAEATGNFITVMDALKLNYRAKDQLHPLMAELLLSINRVTNQDFENRSKLIEWIVKINKMKADETLNDHEARELLFELDQAYKSFYTLLE